MVTIETVKQLLEKFEVVGWEQITEKTRLFLDLGIDSVTIIGIICEFEDQNQVVFDEDQIDFSEDLTIGEFIEMLNEMV